MPSRSLSSIRVSNIDLFNRLDAQPLWDSWSTLLYPKNLEDAIWWGNWLRTSFGDVATAIYRKESYFLDGIELSNDMKDIDSRDEFTLDLINRHRVLEHLASVGLDIQFYGNSFSSAFQPITRVLVCPKCRQQRYLSALTRGIDYDFNKGEFISTCPASGCKYSGAFKTKVYANNNADKPLNVVFWHPMSINLDYCNITGAEKITYTPMPKDRSFLDDEASSAALESLPDQLLHALVDGSSLQFKKDACIHLSSVSDSVSSTELGGWGLPKFLPAFRYVVMLMLLDRQTEAAVKDFILPIRLLFPDPSYSKGGSDPVAGVNIMHMGNLRRSVEAAIAAQSYQQSSWQMVPAPVGQLTLGGDGKALVPVEVLNYVKTTLLDILNVPAEFFQSSLQSATAAANSMRLFEQTNIHDIGVKNSWFRWYLRRCTSELGFPEMSGEVITPADTQNQERMSILMGLRQEGLVSGKTIARMFGINLDRERVRVKEEQIRMANDQREIQQRINQSDTLYSTMTMSGQAGLEMMAGNEQAAAQGQPPMDPVAAQGGAPMPAQGVMPPQGGGDPISQIRGLKSVSAPAAATPDQLNADAEVAADILFYTPIGSPREQIYATLREANETLLAIVKSKLQKKEQMAASQGLAAARQGQ